jgi:chaperonin cofactor prefoldin
LEIVPQIKPDCKDSLYIKVYSKEEIDLLFNHAAAREEERLKVLKQTLQSTLEDAVFKAAIQGDQIDRIEDEVWKRVAVKYRREIGEMEASLTALKAQAEEIRKSTEALQAKLQSLQPATAVPAASPAPGQP